MRGRGAIRLDAAMRHCALPGNQRGKGVRGSLLPDGTGLGENIVRQQSSDGGIMAWDPDAASDVAVNPTGR